MFQITIHLLILKYRCWQNVMDAKWNIYRTKTRTLSDRKKVKMMEISFAFTDLLRNIIVLCMKRIYNVFSLLLTIIIIVVVVVAAAVAQLQERYLYGVWVAVSGPRTFFGHRQLYRLIVVGSTTQLPKSYLFLTNLSKTWSYGSCGRQNLIFQ